MASNDNKAVNADKAALMAHARAEASRFGLDPARFLASLDTENNWRNDRRSKAGAVGVAQIMPEWFPKLKTSAEQLEKDPFLGVTLGAQIRAIAQKDANGDQDLTDAFYNASPKAVRRFMEGKGELPKETQAYILKNRAKAAGFGGEPYTPEVDAALRKQLGVANGGPRTKDLLKMAGMPTIPQTGFEPVRNDAPMPEPMPLNDMAPIAQQEPQTIDPMPTVDPAVVQAPATAPAPSRDEILNTAFAYQEPEQVEVPDWFSAMIRAEVEKA